MKTRTSPDTYKHVEANVYNEPGAVRFELDPEAEWLPAEASLKLEDLDFGDVTVAQMTLSGRTRDWLDPDPDKGAAEVSIELTIEQLEDLAITIGNLIIVAKTERGFALQPDGVWAKGSD